MNNLRYTVFGRSRRLGPVTFSAWHFQVEAFWQRFGIVWYGYFKRTPPTIGTKFVWHPYHWPSLSGDDDGE